MTIASRLHELKTFVALALVISTMPLPAAASNKVNTNLGCFAVPKARSLKKASLAACRELCAARKYPIYTYDWTRGCGCTAVFPRQSRRVAASLCKTRTPYTGTWLYMHNGTAGQNCSINPRTFRPKDWTIEANPHLVEFTAPAGVKLTAEGTVSPRLQLTGGPQKYGYFGVRVKMAGPQQGPVTAVYWTANPDPQDRKDLQEIDLEFINYLKQTPRPGCLSLNHFKGGISIGNETTICPADVRKLAELHYTPAPSEISYLYSVDWQPTYIRWYFQNRLIHERLYSDTSLVPSKEMFLTISVWQWDAWNCIYFGGCASGTYSSQFDDIQVITCS